MTAFSLVMLGMLFSCCCFAIVVALWLSSLSLSLSFFFFLIIKTVCLQCSYFTTETLARGGIDIFRSLRQISTRCSSAKALSFWRKERSHKPSHAGIMRSYISFNV